MITITNGHKSCYQGDIKIIIGDYNVMISAYSIDPEPSEDHLYIWDRLCHDWFWVEDVESIRGEDDLHHSR